MVYKIVKYELIGKVFYTSEPMPNLEAREQAGKPTRFYDKTTNEEYMNSHLWELTTSTKHGAYSHLEEYLPYIADVTQDRYVRSKLVPDTYKNCMLMTEKHGGYLQFFHAPTNEVLLIAMNSHTYEPVK